MGPGWERQGLWRRLTQAAPGHNGARVARGDTLQHRSLVHSQGEVLRPHEDRRLLVDPGARACEEEALSLHFSRDPSCLLTPPATPDMGIETFQPGINPAGREATPGAPGCCSHPSLCSWPCRPLARGGRSDRQSWASPGRAVPGSGPLIPSELSPEAHRTWGVEGPCRRLSDKSPGVAEGGLI